MRINTNTAKNIHQWLILTAVLIGLSGCSTTVQLQRLEPASIDRAAKTKILTVMPFENDAIGLSSSLETKLANKRVNNKNFFTVVSHKNPKYLLEQQKLPDYGRASTTKTGKRPRTQGIIQGEIISAYTDYHYYHEKRVDDRPNDDRDHEHENDSRHHKKHAGDYDDKHGDKKRNEYTVHCTSMTSELITSISMIDAERGDIIFSRQFTADDRYDHCQDKSGGLPDANSVMFELGQEVADDFVELITPNSVLVNIELLDEPEIAYTDEQEDMLENAIQYLDNGYIEQAAKLLEKLQKSTANRCYVATYNLGVAREMQMQFYKAQSLYNQADRLSSKPDNVVQQAISRIAKTIHDQALLKKQL